MHSYSKYTDQGTLDIKYSPHTDPDQNIQTDVDNTDVQRLCSIMEKLREL